MNRIPFLTNDPTIIPSRGELLRDVIIFQIKLIIDGFRDVIIFPISLGAGLIDFILGTQYFHGFFYRVLKAGRQTEEVINLFEKADRV